MVRRSAEPPPSNDKGNGRRRLSQRDLVHIRQLHDELGIARCPVCRVPLIARQGRHGPAFFCACVKKPRKKAS